MSSIEARRYRRRHVDIYVDATHRHRLTKDEGIEDGRFDLRVRPLVAADRARAKAAGMTGTLIIS